MIYGQKLIMGQAQDPNSLVSFLSAQKDRIDFVLGLKEPQLPCLYITC